MAHPPHIALLRGINVGGKNKLLMRELVALFEVAGATDVRTYIQSGNVVFRASATTVKRIPKTVADAIAKQHGLDVPVVLRSASEWCKAIERNPLRGTPDDAKQLYVGFLATKPTAAALKQLDPDRSPGDTFAVVGREVYVRCPDGVARTKLTNQYFDSRLKTISTFRNWKTTLKLAELLE